MGRPHINSETSFNFGWLEFQWILIMDIIYNVYYVGIKLDVLFTFFFNCQPGKGDKHEFTLLVIWAKLYL